MYAIAELSGTVYVGTLYGLGQRGSDGRYTDTGLTSRTVRDMAMLADRVLVVTVFNVLGVFANGGAIVQADGFNNLHSVAVAEDGHMWLGDAESGLNHFERPSGNNRPALITGNIYPSGPYDSPFGEVVLDTYGNLWMQLSEGCRVRVLQVVQR